VHMDYFDANTTYSVQCADDPGGAYASAYSVTTDGNGHFDGELGCYHGSRGWGTYQAYVLVNGTAYEKRAWN